MGIEKTIKRIIVGLCLVMVVYTVIACGNVQNLETKVVEDFALGVTEYEDIKRQNPEICKQYTDGRQKVWNSEKQVFLYILQPTSCGKYTINSVEGSMTFKYSEDGVLISARFKPDDSSTGNISLLREWWEKQYSDFTVDIDTENVIMRSNDKMEVTFSKMSVCYIEWKLCE